MDLSKSPTRIARIARGSGTHPQEVDALLKTHKQFEGVVKKMGKSGMMKGGEAGMQKMMQRNPNQAMAQLGKSMDPRMLQQMGGPQNIMNMMKQMGGGGGGMPGLMGGRGGQGMPDMEEMMAAMANMK